MTLTERAVQENGLTYQEAVSFNNEMKWRSLGEITVSDAINTWLNSLQSAHTRANYASGIKKLIELEIIHPIHTLQQLTLFAGNSLIDRIREVPDWSEATRMARSALLLSFFRFLSRRTDGIIRRLEPSKEGENKTFYKIRDEVVTPAMSQSQWAKWLKEVGKMNKRDCLIAKITLQGGKRIGEVLSLKTEQIDFEKGEITFKQSKSRTKRQTIISYPESVMRELKEYVGNRKGIVFVTATGKAVSRIQVAYTFAKSGERSGVPFRVTPHVLRASAITYLKGQGYTDSQIRQITGHASGEMVSAYDKRSKADNISKVVSLVG